MYWRVFGHIMYLLKFGIGFKLYDIQCKNLAFDRHHRQFYTGGFGHSGRPGTGTVDNTAGCQCSRPGLS
jgi:hypothetical protein